MLRYPFLAVFFFLFLFPSFCAEGGGWVGEGIRAVDDSSSILPHGVYLIVSVGSWVCTIYCNKIWTANCAAVTCGASDSMYP